MCECVHVVFFYIEILFQFVRTVSSELENDSTQKMKKKQKKKYRLGIAIQSIFVYKSNVEGKNVIRMYQSSDELHENLFGYGQPKERERKNKQIWFYFDWYAMSWNWMMFCQNANADPNPVRCSTFLYTANVLQNLIINCPSRSVLLFNHVIFDVICKPIATIIITSVYINRERERESERA